MHWARQFRLAGVLTGGAGHVTPTKGTTAIGLRKVARLSNGSCCLLCVLKSLVGSEAVIRSSSGKSSFLCQRIGGEHSWCAQHTAVFTVRFGFRYAYGIGGVELGM